MMPTTMNPLLEKRIHEERDRNMASIPLLEPQLVSQPSQGRKDECGPCPILEETPDAMDGEATT